VSELEKGFGSVWPEQRQNGPKGQEQIVLDREAQHAPHGRVSRGCPESTVAPSEKSKP